MIMQVPIVINGMAEGIKDCPQRHCHKANIATPKLLQISHSIGSNLN
ncbi:MAG: hypothetical protein GQ583_11020 [Methyloprofundus sp.]|nr:hypothetical protein [Methyloprofundus sp.]